MMEAARTSETSVDNYFTRQYIPEDKSELHTRRRENLKSHVVIHWFCTLCDKNARKFLNCNRSKQTEKDNINTDWKNGERFGNRRQFHVSRALLDKLIVVKLNPPFYGIKVHCHIHKSPPGLDQSRQYTPILFP
jgi:hypothetical protein